MRRGFGEAGVIENRARTADRRFTFGSGLRTLGWAGDITPERTLFVSRALFFSAFARGASAPWRAGIEWS
jgi:hypothetical protein